MDMTQDSPKPFNLTMVGLGVPREFNPHGMGHWVGENGTYYLYVINHRLSGDVVESFEYKSLEKKLIHRKTFSSSLFCNLNDVVVVGVDQFYASMDHYFTNPYLILLETHLRVALGCVVYYDGVKGMVASENLKYPNGITKSKDGRSVWREGGRDGKGEGGGKRVGVEGRV
jgi:arylesterase/paraoxonase